MKLDAGKRILPASSIYPLIHSSIPCSDRCPAVMVIGIRWALRMFRRILLELLEQQFNPFLELRIPPLSPCCGVELNIDVGSHAMVFDLPLPFRSVEGEVRGGYRATVNQRGVTSDPDQAAPGAFSDEFSDTHASEHIGHVIAAGPRVLVDQHRLRTGHCAERLPPIFAVAHCPVAHQRLTQIVDYVISRLTAAVESLINHRALFVQLGKEVPIEKLVAASRRIR